MRPAAIGLAVLTLCGAGPALAQESQPVTRQEMRERNRQDLNDAILEQRATGRERDLIQLRRLQTLRNERRLSAPPAESRPANPIRRQNGTVQTQ